MNLIVTWLALGAAGLTLVLTLVRLIQRRRFSTLLGLVFGLPAIYGGWLAFTTPPDHVFGFAPSGIVGAAALAVHGALALTPLVIVFIWQLQLNLSPQRLWSVGSDLVACALIVAAIELVGWPANLVVVLEVLISGVVFAELAIIIAKISRGGAARWLTVFYFGLWCAALVVVLFGHVAQSSLIVLGTLFLAIICLDGMAGNAPWRLLVTVPLVLAVGVLGAANVFAPFTGARGVSFNVWLEAAGAGAVFMFVAPLIDWSQAQLKIRLSAEQERVHKEQQAARDLKRARDQRKFFQWLADQLTGKEAETAAQLAQMQAQGRADEERLARLAPLVRRLVTDLDGITAALFFGLLIGYYVLIHFAAALPNPIPLLRPIAGATLITVVGIVLNQAITRSVVSGRSLGAGASETFRTAATFNPLRRVVSIFLNLILAIYAVGGNLGVVATKGDCSDPTNTACLLISSLNEAPRTVGIAPLVLLSNGAFWIEAGRVIAGVALVLLAIGQWRFVAIVNNAQKAVQGNLTHEGTVPLVAQPAPTAAPAGTAR